ncbi:hypothetical protein JG688_00016967 [Phytophthora aleatoria]|uniref:Uncharacterized protein n=1 Tax=Phytophthora aleatoria TaxID=2496075 RepID=A0A8J5MCI0_9STRA|nr:hypothetical protein JG688_00016967 [Phytophthora aleatoria]
MHFPYILTKKFGLSKEVMKLVHEGMLSPHGLSSTVENIKRRREKRYYKLLCLFADQVRHNMLSNPLYLSPCPPSVVQYCEKQSPLGPALCEQIMRCTQVKRALRMDHSVKFCKRLKIWPGGTGKRESMKDAKMLLLLQNEIGQIVGRRLTHSENNDETRELLEHVKSAFPVETDSNTCVIVSDNANSVRSMKNVFGSSVSVRQAPFHVFQRFTEKVKDMGTSKRLARQLHETLYTVDEYLRVPSEMAARVQEAVSLVSPKYLNCSERDWCGTLSSNLDQIRLGDLYVETDTYDEGGGKKYSSPIHKPVGRIAFCTQEATSSVCVS